MDKSNSSIDIAPETPGVMIDSVPMLTPPKIAQVASLGVTMSHVNNASHSASLNVINCNANASENSNVDDEDNDEDNSNDNMQNSPALDFPEMRQQSRALVSERSVNATSSASNWNMSLNRDTTRYGRRRRANSFEETLPMPRISLRPRFRRHANADFDVHVPNSSDSNSHAYHDHHRDRTFNRNSQQETLGLQGIAMDMGMHTDIDVDTDIDMGIDMDTTMAWGQHDCHDNSRDCSCIDCMVNTNSTMNTTNATSNGFQSRNQFNGNNYSNNERRSSRSRHFRNHTYSGSDASTDIFAEALSLEASSSGIRNMFSSPLENTSTTHDYSQQSAPTVQIVHNSFQMNLLNHNLPPAAQTFAAPTSSVNPGTGIGTIGADVANDASFMPTSTSNLTTLRPIPRHHHNRTGTGDMNMLLSLLQPSHQHQSRPTPTGTGASNQSASVFTASPSLGTPNCTCTISTSSVSAFDQTSPPQWQDQSPENSAHCQSSPDSQKNSNVIQRHDHLGLNEQGNEAENESEFPFDEVRVLFYKGERELGNPQQQHQHQPQSIKKS